jgi:hypothetical protein
VLTALLACRTDAPFEGRPPEFVPRLGGVVVSTDTLTASADAFARSQAPDKNYGAHDSLVVRSFSGNTHLNTASVRFDQAAIEARVGSGHLDSARLQLKIKQVFGLAN